VGSFESVEQFTFPTDAVLIAKGVPQKVQH